MKKIRKLTDKEIIEVAKKFFDTSSVDSHEKVHKLLYVRPNIKARGVSIYNNGRLVGYVIAENEYMSYFLAPNKVKVLS